MERELAEKKGSQEENPTCHGATGEGDMAQGSAAGEPLCRQKSELLQRS